MEGGADKLRRGSKYREDELGDASADDDDHGDSDDGNGATVQQTTTAMTIAMA